MWCYQTLRETQIKCLFWQIDSTIAEVYGLSAKVKLQIKDRN